MSKARAKISAAQKGVEDLVALSEAYEQRGRKERHENK
jgi:hypothetical protein